MPFVYLCTLFLCAASLNAAEPLTFPLFPDGAPGGLTPLSEATIKLRASYGSSPTRVTDVSDPEITVYRAEKPGGTCVIVAPGGGYMFLSYATEGTQVCEWLNSIGVTAVLLKYRCPTRDDARTWEKPAADARRALEIVRQHAAEWEIDPKRVGLLGFSAGGNLLGRVACDASGPRPDFGVMIYGGGFLDQNDKSRFRDDFSVPADAPPMFFAVAHDDKANPIEATMLYLECKKKSIPAELHIFAKGGHGFGMRKTGHPIDGWPQRCADWMRSMGWVK